MKTAREDPGEPQDLESVDARLAGLSERIREGMLRQGAALTDERTALAARESMQRLLQAERRRVLRRRVVWLTLALAAAAILLLVFVPRGGTDSGDEDRLPLGSQGVRLIRPLGEVRDFERFEWEGELPEGGWFELSLRDAAGVVLVVQPPELREPRWIPDEAERARLPDELSWEVRILDAFGRVRAASEPGAAVRARSP